MLTLYKFTTDNTNGCYDTDLLDEMNEALEFMLDASDQDVRDQNEKNFSGWIMCVSEDGMSSGAIVQACRDQYGWK
jgi:hypothetical protein